MSSTLPLPALRTASPASSTTSRPSADPVGQRADSTAFNAHLHDAQQQSQASNSRSSTDTSSTSKAAVSSTTSATNNDATHAQTGTSSSACTQDNTDVADGSTSAATQVLGLIDQSSGDANAATTASTDGKAPAGKTPPQDADIKPVQQGAVPTAVIGAPVPLPPSNNQAATQGASSTAASGVLPATTTTGTMASGQTLGKPAGAFSATDDADADDADDASDDNDAVGSVLAQSVDTTAQTSVSNLLGSGHNALIAATPATTTAGQTLDTGDLASLRGALATPVLGAPATSNVTPHSLNINASVTSPSFSQELGQQVTWLGGQDIKQAQIRLNPQELGPLDVKVSVEHGRVDVVFSAQHPVAVAAVQQSLDQLNQMLGGHGLSLGQATVGQQTAQQQFGSSQGQTSPASAKTNEAESIDADVATSSQPLATGLVDAFA